MIIQLRYEKACLRAFVTCLFVAINICDGVKNPCFNSSCIQMKTGPYYMCQNCSHRKNGFNCDIGMIFIVFIQVLKSKVLIWSNDFDQLKVSKIVLYLETQIYHKQFIPNRVEKI